MEEAKMLMKRKRGFDGHTTSTGRGGRLQSEVRWRFSKYMG